jgi:uncharacterized protein YdaU (DUF1376 family)
MTTKNKAPAFQLYAADFLADENVVCMSLNERGAYITLMCFCWREGSIPSDLESLSALCGVDIDTMSGIWKRVQKCFNPHKKNEQRLIHFRLEKERKKQKEHSKKRSEAGLKGAKTRWVGNDTTDSKCHSNAIQKPMAKNSFSSSISSSSSITNPPTPKGEKASFKKEFDRFWQPYPKKENMPGAMKAFERAIRSADVSEILSGIEAWKKSGKWDDPKFIPHAASFLNGRRWEDEVGVKPSKGGKPLHKKLFEAEDAENIFNVSDEPQRIRMADYEYVPKGYFGQEGLKHRKKEEMLCLKNYRPVEAPKEVVENG